MRKCAAGAILHPPAALLLEAGSAGAVRPQIERAEAEQAVDVLRRVAGIILAGAVFKITGGAFVLPGRFRWHFLRALSFFTLLWYISHISYIPP